MRRFIPPVVIFVLLALLFAVSPVYGVITWDSYNDSPGGTQDDTFSDSETTVYMYGTGFTVDTPYKVAYYDSSGTKVATDSMWSDETTGDLESSYYFPNDQTADTGLWHAVAYEWPNTPPTTWIENDSNADADDSFTVEASAIPEFPTVVAMVAAMGLSLGIYYWMRKRYQRQVVTVNPRR